MRSDQKTLRQTLRAPAIQIVAGALLQLSASMLHVDVATAQVSTAAGAQWKLSPQPVLTIGEDGTPQGEFLRIGGAIRTTSGNIVVANTSSNELRVFSPAGKFVKAYGRTGSGPGELERMQWIGRGGDTVHVFDFRNRRISTFSASTGYLKSRPVPAGLPDRSSYPVSRFSNGDYLIQPIGSTSMSHRDGVYTDSIQAGVLVAARDTITFFGTYPHLTYLAFNPTNAEKAQSVGVYRFGGIAHWQVWGNLTWIAHSNTNEFVLYDKTGKKINTIKLPWPAREFDKAAFDKVAKRELADAPESQRAGFMNALLSAKYLPKYEPTFRRFKVAADGMLWIERYRLDPTVAGECVVMNRSGNIVARITLPGNFESTEIGNDYVLGIQKDSDGLETVAMYRIWK